MGFYGVMIRISIALYNSENQALMSFGEDLKNRFTIRKNHRNKILEKLSQGQRDEKFVQDYYEILKKADKFMSTATPEKIEMAVNKYGMNLGQKDKWGRRYEHFGFFDPKHKNYGKTLAEAAKAEVLERTTDDDDYEVVYMFSNKPIEDGLAKLNELIGDEKNGYQALSEVEKAKIKRFPLSIVREKETVNKIEQLTDFLHIKKVGSDYMLLEFFISKKFKLYEHLSNDKIFNELINFKQAWIKDEYGTRYGYTIDKYYKYTDYDSKYDVLKFYAYKIENI